MDTPRRGSTRRRIKRRIRKKISAWIKSIDSEEVRKVLKKDVIVTGGSIASMLLGEQVNDYDVYLRDIDSTELIAQHYAHEMNIQKGIPDYVKVIRDERVNIKGEEEDRVLNFIKSAGQAVDPNTDLDQDDEDLPTYMEEDKNKEQDYHPVFISENAITLSGSVQIVTRFYGEPDDIHRNYDFVHACNYYDYGKDELVLKPQALEALLSRRLTYVGSLYPIASLFRMRKFIDRGWKINAGEILKIAWQVSELDLTDLDVLREQLTGVDMAYFENVIMALKDGAPENGYDSNYVVEIINRVFND